MNFNFTAMTQTVTAVLTAVGLKILGAIVLWMIGRWLISLSLRLIGSALRKQKIDPATSTRAWARC
jgi:small conductance mechanosensitive channel